MAQSGAGAIQGTVKDATGALVVGAQIEVRNLQTGTVSEAKTDKSGFYEVPDLFVGKYEILVTQPSLAGYDGTIDLQAAQTAVINPVLKPDTVTMQVTVSTEVQLTTQDSGTISNTLDNDRIQSLPENGRNVQNLVQLTTPGMEAGGTRANGNMGEALEYVQDGAALVNRNMGGSTGSVGAQFPDPDSIQEVRVETANSSAAFATPGTAIMTTKSGTNRIHGSLFETARNNGFGLARARQDPSDARAPKLVRNEFGISVGGPIVIPKVYNGRNRSFFFLAFEHYSLRSFQSQLMNVPTAAERQGDFSFLTSDEGAAPAIFDPATSDPVTFERKQFAGNRIDPSRESPLAKALFAIVPLPTNNQNPLLSTDHNFTSNSIVNGDAPTTTFRLDHVFDVNNRVYLRFTAVTQSHFTLRNSPSSEPVTLAGGGLPAAVSGEQSLPVSTYSAALGFTHVFSPSFFVESVLSQQWFSQFYRGGGNPNLDYEQMLGLPNNFGEKGFPYISNIVSPYTGTQFAFGVSQIISNLDENFTKIIGKHQMQFGGRYRHERLGSLPDQVADQIPFGGLGTAQYATSTFPNYLPEGGTGLADADFFLGSATSYSVNYNAPYAHYRDMEIDSYFQDNIHVSSRFTVNAGIRWEIHPAPYTKDGLTQSFDLAHKAIVMANAPSFYVNKGYTTAATVANLQNLGVQFETPQQAGIPNSMFYDNDFTFSPRIGAAYTMGSKYPTVFRGGYGRYIYPEPVRDALKNADANPPLFISYAKSYIQANQSPDGLPNYILRKPQAVVAGQNSSNVVDTTSPGAILPGIGMITLAPHYPPDFVTQGNATVEQTIKGHMAIRLTYLYNHGANLGQFYRYNYPVSTYVYELTHGTPIPTGIYSSTAAGPYDQTTYGTSSIYQKSGWSNNNSGQINLIRPFRNGYSFQIFYTMSHAYRVGGNTFRDTVLFPAGDYAPGILPTNDLKGIDRFENYVLDTAIPQHHIQFNGLVSLPFGRGKKFFSNANRWLDYLVGGYQISGAGQVLSQQFQVASKNYGATSPIRLYKQHHVVDCRSGVCQKENLWFNGYIPPDTTHLISNLPSDYVPYVAPINNNPLGANYETNYVPLTLKNGQITQVAYSPGPAATAPYPRTFLHGPYNYNADLSLFKVIHLNDRYTLRINVDAFNAFNIQGYNNPDITSGIETFTSSYWAARQLQLTARLSF